jgi:hypothetical protein
VQKAEIVELQLVIVELQLINVELQLVNVELQLVNVELQLINVELQLINVELQLINVELQLINVELQLINVELQLVNVEHHFSLFWLFWGAFSVVLLSVIRYPVIIGSFSRNAGISPTIIKLRLSFPTGETPASLKRPIDN